MPCRKEACVGSQEDEARKQSLYPNDSKWLKLVTLAYRNKMDRPFKSLVVETVHQLCSRNEELEKCGVTHKQLHTVLSLSLSRGTSPALITALIEKEINFKNIVKNKLGNYTMNPDIKDFESLLTPEENDTSVPEIKLKDTSSLLKKDFPDMVKKNSPDKKESSQSTDKETEEPSGSEKMEDDEEEDKPVRKQRKRKAKKLKADEEMEVEQSEAERLERSPSPNQQARKTGCSVLVTNSNGRRIIRKITKYDPSEFYLTPLIRKKNKSVVSVEESKPKLKRGRPPLKAKLAAAAAFAVLSSNNTAPLKKLDRIKRDSKSNKPQTSSETSKGIKTPPPSPKALSAPKLPSGTKPPPEQDKQPPEPEVDVEMLEQVKIETPKPTTKSSASMLKNECYLCSKLANINDELTTLACALCLNIAHNSCVIDDGFYKDLKKWRCSECLITNPVVCSVCDKEYKKSDGSMLMCDFCDEIFHAHCHVPPVKLPVSMFSWRCSLCPQLSLTDVLMGGREDLKSTVGTYAFTINKVNAPACGGVVCIPGPQKPLPQNDPPDEPSESCPPPSTPAAPQSPLPDETTEPAPLSQELVQIKEEAPDDITVFKEEVDSLNDVAKEKEALAPLYKFHRPGEPIPKVDDWTTQQVAQYFADKFGPTVGNAFLTQEIDGPCLKLMRRIDVTDGLGLQFGIALKVLYYVKKIQLNTNVIKELWT